MSEAPVAKSDIHRQVTIEQAKPEDVEAICDIRDRAWLEAYPNTDLGLTKEDIKLNAQGRDGVFVPRRIAYLKKQLATLDPSGLGVYVAKLDGAVVGYTHLVVDEQGRPCIGAMYVAPEAQGAGIGGMLMGQALNVLGRDKDIYLEVVSYNAKAIGFYEHYGFEKTDAIVPEEEGRPEYLKSIPQIEMVLRATQL